jgi:parallel beta-helix repeat protein
MLSIGPLFNATGESLKVYVSPQGNDTWSGRLDAPNSAKTDGPFATLQHARESLPRLKRDPAAAAGVTVLVREGSYEPKQTLAFGPEHGGSAAAPVVIRAFGNEHPIIRGGRKLVGFAADHGSVVKADLAAQGLAGASFRELFFAGRRVPLARYPNADPDNPYGGGWAFADGKLMPMYEDQPGEVNNELHYKPQDARKWTNPTDVEVFVFPRYNWWNNIIPIRRIDSERRMITFRDNASYPIRPGDRYYFQGAREELDAPGEWYLDRERNTLFFWPPEPIDEAHQVVAPLVGNLISVGPKTANLTLRGFTLETCTGEAVALRETTDCLVAGCTVRGVGNYNHSGISVTGGRRNQIVGNDICDIGSHGITISGGDRVTLTPAENVADNNYIHHVGVLYKQGVGVSLEGVGNVASHNYIHDGPRMGIMFSGNNLVLEYNHVRHMNLETEDTGAVYTGGRDWISSRGTVIRYNLFHDMLGFGKDAEGKWVSPHFAWGVYLDDNTGGVDVIGNIVYRCSRAGLHLHNGRDNHIFNNIFVDNGPQQYEYSGWTGTSGMWKDHFPTMVKGYEMVAQSPAWRNMRNMNVHPRDAVLPNRQIMTGNDFERNVIVYRGRGAALVRTNDVPFDHNKADYNLFWHHGLPIKTGQHKPGNDISANLAPNGSFEKGELGKLPEFWQWQIHTPRSEAGLIYEGGRRTLEIAAAFDDSKPRDNYPIIVSNEFEAKPGQSYRVSARMKADRAGAKAGLMLQGYVANVFFWANWPNEIKVGTEWRDYDFVFTIPAPGERGHNDQMKLFRARVDFPGRKGTLFVQSVSVREIAMLDEWASWQALGNDVHSKVTDPLFRDAAHDDFRLEPSSPAFALGFQPIPVDKIGPYRDELRASWPIVDAPGVREHPIRVPQ